MSDETPRYDILMVPPQRSMKVGNGAADALIRYLATIRIMRPTDEAIAHTWAEVYGEPGPSAHDAFVMKGSYQSDEALFHECIVRFGTAPCSPGYGTNTEVIHFYLEFRGCIFEKPAGRFLVKMKDILRFQPDVCTRPHEGLPAHATVSEDEKPKDTRLKRRPLGGPAGTTVEEF
jgi:hypothetical protein